MRKIRLSRPSPAMIVAIVALFAALCGGAYAVARNSVGTAQLKDGAVTPPKVNARKGALVRGFATIKANGHIIHKGGIVRSVKHPSKGVYCFNLRGHAKTAVASMDGNSRADTYAVVSLSVGSPCVAPNTDAGVYVNLIGTGLWSDIFHVAFF